MNVSSTARLRTAESLLVLGLAGITPACSDSTGVDPQDLTGTWTSTALVASNPANPAQSVDLVDLGFSLSLTIESSGAVEVVLAGLGEVDTLAGTITVTGDQVTLVLDGDASTGTISRQGDRLTLDIETGVEFDFDGDGLDEPATLLVELRRTG